MKPEDKERVLVEVVQRVLDRWTREPGGAEHALLDTIWEERRRLEGDPDTSAAAEWSAFYDRVYAEVVHASPQRQRELLREVLERFVDEVAGHFDPRVYALATRAIPPALNVLLNTLSPIRLIESLPGGGGRMDEQVELAGDVEGLRAMASLGTTILVPTHVSNLDSVLMGFAIYRLGLPPYVYGAGLNLFSNKLIGFFMHHLGAYRVDRRKKAQVYTDVLKAYAGCSLELGYHNLFFPGGTRSRSGAFERRLKLGLLGTGLDAYLHNLRARAAKPDVFVVPCTINYSLVLEAETLIDDWLKEEGKARYVIEDDEFSKPRRVLEFVKKLFTLHSRVHLWFGRPMDVFGNEVDRDGRSLDPRGRPVDRARYVLCNGVPDRDPQRDGEYVRELARAVTAAYHRDTVVKSTQVACFVAMRMLRDRHPEVDLYRLLRNGGDEESLPLPEFYARLEEALGRLRGLAEAGRLRLDEGVAGRDMVAIASEALAHLGSYHLHPALTRRGDRLFPTDRNLLLYYANRLAAHPSIGPEAARAWAVARTQPVELGGNRDEVGEARGPGGRRGRVGSGPGGGARGGRPKDSPVGAPG